MKKILKEADQTMDLWQAILSEKILQNQTGIKKWLNMNVSKLDR